jgi:hypothetical protein
MSRRVKGFRRDRQRYVWVFTFQLTIALVFTVPALAQAPPQHLTSMAADLLRSTKEKLEAQSGDSGRALAVKHAYNLIKEEQMFRWGRKTVELTGLVPKLATALGIKKVEPKDIPNIQKLLDAYARGDADRGILDLYEGYGREKPTKEEIVETKKKIYEAMQSARKDLPLSHTIVRADGRQRITLRWKPEASRFLIKIEDDGDEDTEPYQTNIGGDVKAEVSEDGQDTKLSVVPLDDPIKPMTAKDLEEIKREIYGEWKDQKGNLWTITPPQGSAPGPTPPAPGQDESPAQKIAALEKRIKEIKKSRIYVWENPQTGEVVKQKRFKSLKEPFIYNEGEYYAKPNARAEMSRLEKEIKELSRVKLKLPVQAHDPVGFKDAASSAKAQPIHLSLEDASGYKVVYDEANLSGDRIVARRTLRDLRDITNLPKPLVANLVRSWSPPEWVELTIERDVRTGEEVIEGKRWRLHVTWDRDGYLVDSIHTPYSVPRVLTREGSDKPKLRFVRVLEEIVGNLRFYGGPIFLEARYDSEQDDTEKVALLEWEPGEGRGSESREIVVTRTPEDPRLYRSTAIYVLPPPIQEEPAQPPLTGQEQPSPGVRVEP